MTSLVVYADEDVNIAVIEGLKRRGIEAYSYRDFRNFGLSDEEQVEFSRRKNFVLLTHDTDFLRIVHEKRVEHCGIIFVSQTKMSVGEIIRRIEHLVSILPFEDMKNHIEFL